MTRIHLPIRNGGESIDTAMEEDIAYPFGDQGRNATNPVPPISMLAGKPTCEHYERTQEDNDYRAKFWLRLLCVYVVAVIGAVVMAAVRHA